MNHPFEQEYLDAIDNDAYDNAGAGNSDALRRMVKAIFEEKGFQNETFAAGYKYAASQVLKFIREELSR